MVVGSCVLLLGLTSGSCAGPNNSTTPLRLGVEREKKRVAVFGRGLSVALAIRALHPGRSSGQHLRRPGSLV